jgi:hypothetical protein
MLDQTEKHIIANEAASTFYRRWKNDSRSSIYVYAPISVAICVTCFVMIVGYSSKLMVVLLLPLLVIVAAFIYVPIISRKKYMNGIIKKATITNERISIETFKWFYNDSICISTNLSSVSVKRLAQDSFFGEAKVLLLEEKNNEFSSLYLVEEFLENSPFLLDKLSKE